MDLSIVILSYDREHVCEELVKHIFSQKILCEIIVIDNGSQTPYSFNCKGCRVIRLDKNEVVPKARNVGVKRAKGKYIMMMDDDNDIDARSIRKLYDYLNIYTSVDIVFPQKMDVYQDGRIIYYGFFKPNISGNLKRMDANHADLVPFGTMVCMGKKEAINYDEDFGINPWKGKGYAIREESAMHAKASIKRAITTATAYHYVDKYSGGASKEKKDIAYWTGYGNALFIKRYLRFGYTRSFLWLGTYGFGHFVLRKFDFGLFKGWYHGMVR